MDKNYREAHKVCPNCGSEYHSSTYAAYVYPPDKNKVECSCGWSGIVDDLVSRALKAGDLASVWYRDSSHHKWLMEYSLVYILQISCDDVIFQTSATGNHYERTVPTSVALRGGGTWERELRLSVYWTNPDTIKGVK